MPKQELEQQIIACTKKYKWQRHALCRQWLEEQGIPHWVHGNGRIELFNIYHASDTIQPVDFWPTTCRLRIGTKSIRTMPLILNELKKIYYLENQDENINE